MAKVAIYIEEEDVTLVTFILDEKARIQEPFRTLIRYKIDGEYTDIEAKARRRFKEPKKKSKP